MRGESVDGEGGFRGLGRDSRVKSGNFMLEDGSVPVRMNDEVQGQNMLPESK